MRGNIDDITEKRVVLNYIKRKGGKTKMPYEEIERIRKEIENWVKLIGKKRTEELLRISIFGLEDLEKEHHSVVYE